MLFPDKGGFVSEQCLSTIINKRKHKIQGFPIQKRIIKTVRFPKDETIVSIGPIGKSKIVAGTRSKPEKLYLIDPDQGIEADTEINTTYVDFFTSSDHVFIPTNECTVLVFDEALGLLNKIDLSPYLKKYSFAIPNNGFVIKQKNAVRFTTNQGNLIIVFECRGTEIKCHDYLPATGSGNILVDGDLIYFMAPHLSQVVVYYFDEKSERFVFQKTFLFQFPHQRIYKGCDGYYMASPYHIAKYTFDFKLIYMIDTRQEPDVFSHASWLRLCVTENENINSFWFSGRMNNIMKIEMIS